MANEYDIVRAFQRIEEELIDSMSRNLSRHIREEEKEGFSWSMWQAEQLKSLKEYKKQNPKLFKKYFSTINKDIDEVLRKMYESGKADQETVILEALKKGKIKNTKTSFFKINDRKLNALIKEAQTGIRKASSSILRYTNDQYRKVIFNAQIYANIGGTPEKAIDMASKDFLTAGINSIQYSNGSRVNIASYAGMAIRTASKRAYLQGEGTKRNEWGIHTVLVHNRGGGCPFCIKWQGKVYIDDVWSGGTAKESEETGYPLLSTAIAGGLYHPNCKDKYTTYFPEISTEPKPPTKEEIEEKKIKYQKDQKSKYIDRKIAEYKRLELGSIDGENAEKYHKKRKEWEGYRKRFKDNPEETFYHNVIKNTAKQQKQSFNKEVENFVNENTKETDFIFDTKFSKPMAYSIYKNKIIINLKHEDLKYYDISETIAHETVHLKDVRNKISEKNFELLKGYVNKTKNYFKSDMAYYGRVVADNENNSSLCDIVNIFTEGRVENGAFAHKEDYIKDELNCVREISATLISCYLTENKPVNNLIDSIKPLKEMKGVVLELWGVSK